MSISVLIIVSSIVGIFSLFSIGSNGVANTQANAVGSGALSLRGAQILAGICEFGGAALVGHHVSNTVGDEIVNHHHVTDLQYCWGMFSALFSAGSWILLCSFFKMPASSTHSIIGSLIGYHLVISSFDFNDLNYSLLGSIAIAWIVTPFMSGTLSFLFLKLLDCYWPVNGHNNNNNYVTSIELKSKISIESQSSDNIPLLISINTHQSSPYKFGIIFGILCTILTLFIMIAGPKEITVHDKYPLYVFPIIAISTFCVTSFIAILFEKYYRQMYIKRFCNYKPQNTTTTTANDKSIFNSSAYFRMYLVIASGAVAFAHGGNDIANVLGPYGQIFLYEINDNLDTEELNVPVYIAAIGGIIIATGFCLFGKNVLQTVGEKITGLTYRTGFAAQFSSALTVLLCNVLGIPVSSSTVIVGGVTGVSVYNNSKINIDSNNNNNNNNNDKNGCRKCYNKIQNMEFKLLGKILFTWIITLPVNGILCGSIYSIINALFL